MMSNTDPKAHVKTDTEPKASKKAMHDKKDTPKDKALAVRDETALDATALANAMVMKQFETVRSIGQIESLVFLRNVADSAIAQAFDKIKKTKSYVGIPYQDEEGKTATVATLEEFCPVFLGKSYRRCQELHSNLSMLGSELYEAAEQIGFQARDYRALKALPADEQSVVKEAIESGDKDAAITTLSQLVTRNHEEKESALDRLQDKDRQYQGLQAVLQDRDERIALFESGNAPPPNWESRVSDNVSEVSKAAIQAIARLMRLEELLQAMDDRGKEPMAPAQEEEYRRAMPNYYREYGQILLDIQEALNSAILSYEHTSGLSLDPDENGEMAEPAPGEANEAGEAGA